MNLFGQGVYLSRSWWRTLERSNFCIQNACIQMKTKLPSPPIEMDDYRHCLFLYEGVLTQWNGKRQGITQIKKWNKMEWDEMGWDGTGLIPFKVPLISNGDSSVVG